MTAKKQSIETTVAVINEKLDVMQKDLTEIKSKMHDDYVSKEEFIPVKNLVYGAVGIILISFISLLIYIVGWSR